MGAASEPPPAAPKAEQKAAYELGELDPGTMLLTVHLPEGVTGMAQLEVELGASRVEVSLADGARPLLRLPLRRAIDDARARCKFSKAHRTLRLTAPFLGEKGIEV